jgi:hypothetical protein
MEISRITTGFWTSSRESYHEPYYRSYLDEDFGAIAESCGLAHVRDVNAFISKVMVFDKVA